MSSIYQLRLMQQYRQSREIDRPGRQQAAIYQSRDPLSGDRVLESADGGIVYGKFLSNSVPRDVPPLVVAGAIGLSARILQRPV